MIELLTIGTELLLGTTVDTNGAWLGARLAETGLRLTRRTTVPDDAAAIREVLRGALERTGTVICTGGLGPTADDLTRPVVAALYRRELRLDEGWLEVMSSRFRARGLEMPLANQTQALVPTGAMLLPNSRGTAPGLLLDDPDLGTTILLPGVPSEMRALTDEHVLPWLVDRFGAPPPILSRTLRTTGIAESTLQERLADLLEPESELPQPGAEPPITERETPTDAARTAQAAVTDAVRAAQAAGADTSRTPRAAVGTAGPQLRDLPLALAFLPTGLGVDLRLTCWGGLSTQAASDALEAGEHLLRARVGESIWGSGDEDLAAVLGQVLRRRSMTLAVAESCTGGLVGQRITHVPGASDYFLGGFIVYANRMKEQLLGVDGATLAAHGAVSEAAVVEMAAGAAAATGADCAIAVTGVAGPDGGTPEKPVGTVWIGVALQGRTLARLHRFAGTREEIRARTAQAAMVMLLRELERP